MQEPFHQQNQFPQSMINDNELIESLLNHFNVNHVDQQKQHQKHQKQHHQQPQRDHLLLLSPSSTNSISTDPLSPLNLPPNHSTHTHRSSIQQPSCSQPQPIYNHHHHHIPSADLSIGFKPSIDRFSISPHPISTSLPDLKPPYSAVDHQTLVLTEKRRRRRESHNAVERRRRDNINDRISELATLLPNCVLDTAVTPSDMGTLGVNESIQSMENATSLNHKPNKGIILAKSVDYIRQLKDLLELQVQANAELEAELNNLRTQLDAKQSESKSRPHEEWFQAVNKGESLLNRSENCGINSVEQNLINTGHNEHENGQKIIIKTEESCLENQGRHSRREDAKENDEMMILINEFCQSNNNYDSPSTSSNHTDHTKGSYVNSVNNSNRPEHINFHHPLSDAPNFDHLHLQSDKYDNLYHYLQ